MIHIYIDHTPKYAAMLSLAEGLERIRIKERYNEEASFFTHCTHFFCFDYLRHNPWVYIENGPPLPLAELLQNDGKWTDKEIRFGHNAEKMLLSGFFGDKYSGGHK